MFLAFSLFSNATTYAISPKKITEITLDKKFGQMICLDFRFQDNKPVTEINDEIRDVIAKYHVDSVILFSQNFSNKDQAKELILKLKKKYVPFNDSKNLKNE